MLRSAPKTNFVRRFSVLMALMAIVLVTGAHAQNSNGTRLLRTPTVSATQIAFAYAQNIWVTPRAGGQARRVTTIVILLPVPQPAFGDPKS